MRQFYAVDMLENPTSSWRDRKVFLSAACFLLVALSASATEVPVDDLAAWTVLSFNRIPPNDVSADARGLRIDVRRSASPLIYKLPEPVVITGFTVDASWAGALMIPAGQVQGDENADDFVLKFGIVEAGDRRLNWLQRRIAAGWIKELFRLAPPDSGVSRIHFYATAQQADLVETSRTHPLSDLLYETRLLLLEQPGPFTLTHDLAEPVEILGIWISADGDDTNSEFELLIERITLRTQ